MHKRLQNANFSPHQCHWVPENPFWHQNCETTDFLSLFCTQTETFSKLFLFRLLQVTLISPCDVRFPCIPVSFSAAMTVAETDFYSNVSFRCSPSLTNHIPTFFSMLEYWFCCIVCSEAFCCVQRANHTYWIFSPSVQQLGQLTLKHEMRSEEVAIVLVSVEELRMVDEKAEDELASAWNRFNLQRRDINSVHPPSWKSYNGLTTAVKIKYISWKFGKCRAITNKTF